MSEVPHSRTVLAEEDIEAAVEVLRSGVVNDSETTRGLEAAAAEALGRKHAWAASSGTDALGISLLLMGIGPGDEVLIPTYVCDDVLSAVIRSGATPVPVDLDPADLNPDPHDAKARSGRATRALVAAHTIGMPARLAELEGIGVPVIEDCAHGLGASLGESPAGSRGHCTVLSFHGLKMITAGEGGMLLTDDPELAAERARRRAPDFAKGIYRLNSRMSNVLAAIAARQLARLPATVERRSALASRYADAVAEIGGAAPVATEAADGRRSSCYRFAIALDEGMAYEEAESGFAEHGVTVRRPIKQLCHRSLGLDPGSYPQAEAAFDRIVSLPLYPDLSDSEQETVIEAARRVLG